MIRSLLFSIAALTLSTSALAGSAYCDGSIRHFGELTGDGNIRPYSFNEIVEGVELLEYVPDLQQGAILDVIAFGIFDTQNKGAELTISFENGKFITKNLESFYSDSSGSCFDLSQHFTNQQRTQITSIKMRALDYGFLYFVESMISPAHLADWSLFQFVASQEEHTRITLNQEKAVPTRFLLRNDVPDMYHGHPVKLECEDKASIFIDESRRWDTDLGIEVDIAGLCQKPTTLELQYAMSRTWALIPD